MYEEHFIESDVYQYDDELEQQFRDAGLDARWPFDGDFERYSEGDIWANQDRLNWVEKMATSS